ncbi:MAG: prenyltransferase/squalene oxidase repeat-containing protein [Pseudomonadota bacterium]
MYIPTHIEAFWWYRYQEISNNKGLIEFIINCQNSDGGIANYNNSVAYLETTFFAIVGLTILGYTERVTDKTISYIKSKENPTGGFGETSSSNPNLFNTFYATICLNLTGNLTHEIRERTLAYINKNIIHKNGIYDSHHDFPSVMAVYWTVMTLKALSVDIYQYKKAIIDFLMECYNHGLFSPTPNSIPTIQHTFEALVVLRELSSIDLVNSNDVSDAIIKRKRGALYYDDLLKKYSFSSSMWALSSLNIIGKLDKLSNFDVLHFTTEIFNNQKSMYDIYCSANILSNMLYEPGQINLNRHSMLSETGPTSSLNNVKDMSIKLLRSGIDLSVFDFSYLLKQTVFNNPLYDNFIQIILSEDDNHIYEIEFVNGKPFCLLNAISRVSKECISIRTLPRGKIKLLGVFNPTEDLQYSDTEASIIRNYCQDNQLVSCETLIGDNVKYNELIGNIKKQCHIFYYSGHTQDGYILTKDKKISIEELLTALCNNNCYIAIFNSCNTYSDVKAFYIKNPAASDNFNVISCISEISDEYAKSFIIYFLYYLELGIPISESLRLAKKDIFILTKSLGSTWWSYLLFGNPYTIIY